MTQEFTNQSNGNITEYERLMEEEKVQQAYEEALYEYRQMRREEKQLIKTIGKVITRER